MSRLRFIALLATILWLLSSCVSREPQNADIALSDGGVVEGQKVKITITVPWTEPATKALGEGGTLNSLWVAVFGGSGYLKDYHEATFVRADNSYGFTMANPSFEFIEFTDKPVEGYVRVDFDSISEEPSGTVVFHAGQTYRMTVTTHYTNQYLFFVEMVFSVDGKTVLCPASFAPEEGKGTVTRYYGSNKMFVWNIPYGTSGHTSAYLDFTAPVGRDVRLESLYIKAFNGSFYNNGLVSPTP